MSAELARTFDDDRRRLLARLRAVRRAGAAASVAAGIAQAWLIVLLGATLAFALDWLLRLPGPLRLALAMGLLVLLAITLHRTVIARLRLPDLPHVARQVASAASRSRDCLPSGVQFALAEPPGYWAQRTVTAAAHLAERLSIPQLIRWRWAAGWLLPAILALLVLLAAWGSVGWWFQRGAARLAWPIVRAEWPKRFAIDSPQAGRTLLAPAGEPLTLHAQITRGSAAAPAWLVLRDATGSTRRIEMTAGEAGRRSATVRPVRSGSFWFEVGDAATQDRPGVMQVVPRPQVTEVQVLVRPPAYTGIGGERLTLGTTPLRVLEGSEVELTIATNKPVAVRQGQPAATVGLTLDSASAGGAAGSQATTLPVRFGRNHRELTARWRASDDALLEIALTDEDCLMSLPRQPWRVVIERDRLPTIEIAAPADGQEVTPAAIVPLQVILRDDWGLTDLQLAHRAARAGNRQEEPFATQSLPLTPAPRAGDGVRVAVEQQWPLSDMQLAPGDRVEWYLQVRDNFELDGARHDPVRSPTMTLRVIGEKEMVAQALEQLAEARQAIESLHAREQALREGMARAARDATSSSNALRALAQDQAQVAQQTAQQSGRLASVAERLEANRISRQDLLDSIERAAERLRDTASRDMSEAQRDLQSAAAGPAEAAEHLGRAADAADRAAEMLADVLRRTAEWTTLETAALDLQNMLDRQATLREQTAETGRQTVGLSSEQLSGAAGAALRSLAQGQRDLADRLARMQADLEAQAKPSEAVAPEQAARLQAAAETLARQAAVAEMTAAADQIARNVMMAAQGRQQAAEQAIREALDALRDAAASPQAAGDEASSPAGLAQTLQDLARREMELRAQTGQLEARRSPSGDLGRADRLRLGVAARSQEQLADRVRETGRSATGPAMQQLLESVGRQMEAVGRQMQAGQSHEGVQEAQRRAAESLTAMAEAYERSPADAQAQAQSDGGQNDSGGTPQAGADPAELQALYLLQRDLLSRTQALDSALPQSPREPAPAPAERSAQADQLGREQQELKDLAEPIVPAESVPQLMAQAAGRLRQNRDAGEQTQAWQRAAMEQLAQLREQARPSSAQASASPPQRQAGLQGSSAGNQPQPSGQQGPPQPGQSGQGGQQAAQDERLGGGQADRVDPPAPPAEGGVEAWGFLPPDQRREVLQGMQAQPPARYRTLTQRYWQILNESVERR